MRKRRVEIQPVRLNLTPMLDMFTFVLIFLIVLFAPEEAKLAQDPHTKLPEASSKLPVGKNIHVELSGDNLRVNSKVIQNLKTAQDWNNLKLALQAASPSMEAISLSADRSTPYEVIDRVVSQLSRLGYSQIYFVTERKDGEKQ
jgi:biopolymer transport protein ExbD